MASAMDYSPAQELFEVMIERQFPCLAILDGTFDDVLAEVQGQNGGDLEPFVINHDPDKYARTRKSQGQAATGLGSGSGSGAGGKSEGSSKGAQAEALSRYVQALRRAESLGHETAAGVLRRWMKEVMNPEELQAAFGSLDPFTTPEALPSSPSSASAVVGGSGLSEEGEGDAIACVAKE